MARHSGTGTLYNATGSESFVEVDNGGTVTNAYGEQNSILVSGSNSRVINGYGSYNSIFYQEPTNSTNLVGQANLVWNQSTGTTTNAKGTEIDVSNTAGGTITNVYGVDILTGNAAAGTVTNNYGIQVNAATIGAGTLTNNAGIAIVDQTAATNNTNLLLGTNTVPSGTFSIYNVSAADNYFAGDLGIGRSNPGAALDVDDSTSSSDVAILRVISDVGGADTVQLWVDSDGDLELLGTIFVRDDQGITFGTDDDATLSYDEAGDNRLELTGSGASLNVEDVLGLGVDARTIADSGDGSPATLTLDPNPSYVEITCSDTDGCDVTMGETNALQGDTLTILNIGANVVNFADSTGVSELSGAFAAGQFDTLELIYTGNEWVEISRSNN